MNQKYIFHQTSTQSMSHEVENYFQFCFLHSLEQLIKFSTWVTCSTSSLIDHILTTLPTNICLDEDVFKTSWSRRVYWPYSYVLRRCLYNVMPRRLQNVLPRRLQDIFKTSSRHLQNVLPRRLAKMSSRHFRDVLKRDLQDVFKAYHQVKLFLLARFQVIFETYSKCFWEVLQRRLSVEGFSYVTLLRNLWSVYKICKSVKSLTLYYTL